MTGFSFGGAWYLDHLFALRMESIILPRINAGKDPIPDNLRLQGRIDAKVDGRERRVADWFRHPSGVGVVPISGAMSREGEYCGYGNEQLASFIDILNRDDDTAAIVLKINSGGGTVDSTKMLAETVKNCTKPVVAWTPYCASAAYFVASQADEIIMENQSVSEVGSIGVLMIHVDQSAALEKQGYKVQIIRADGSEDKARFNGIEPLDEGVLSEQMQVLKAARTEFVGYVRRGRVGKIKSDEVFSGKMYTIKDAIRLGLADRTGSLGDAIKRALQLV